MKKALKKWLALALALALVLSLAACGGNNTAGNDASSNQQNSQNGDNADAQDTQDTSGAPVLEGQMELDYAEKFQIDLYSDGYRMISIDGAQTRYLVVPEGKSVT